MVRVHERQRRRPPDLPFRQDAGRHRPLGRRHRLEIALNQDKDLTTAPRAFLTAREKRISGRTASPEAAALALAAALAARVP